MKKHTLKKIWLLWLCLFLSLFAIEYANAYTINLADLQNLLHKSKLYKLSLSSWSNNKATLIVNKDDLRLEFTGWLVVWSNATASSNYTVIGWWTGNKIERDSSFAAIWGGATNEVNSEYAVIGWWTKNKAQWRNAVILGWDSNAAQSGSVVMWWRSNTSLSWGVVLWWESNTANKNSLALGQRSNWQEGSFIWNSSNSLQTVGENGGYVGASNWILIGTTEGVGWVNLVVNGAVKIAWTKDDINKYKWEIRSVDGCFYGFDGSTRHVLNRWDEVAGNCKSLGVNASCVFGNTILRHWDTATWYSLPNAVHCPSPEKLTCRNGNLFTNTNVQANSYYPYCYEIED